MQPSAPERGDLVAVGGDEVGPEALDVGVDGAVDGRRARRGSRPSTGGDRQLRGGVGALSLRKVKASAKIGLVEVHPPSTAIAAAPNSSFSSALRNAIGIVPGGLVDPAELVDEVHVPRRTAELAVGGALQPDLVLHRDRPADRVVLGGGKRRCADPPRGVLLARRGECRRAQQAADMVGAEGGLGSGGHGLSSLGSP